MRFANSTGGHCGVLYTDTYLSIRWSPADSSVILDGEVDLSNSAAVAKALAEAKSERGEITVDMGALRFIDLAGLRALRTPASPAADDAVRLRNVPPHLRRLLEMLDG
ncbi:STAS domain-containing protein [Microbispora rosea]|uniref:STAS domain-containing protein n=1 Tax=Microbispora rosea TaxID=58117 RepID=UPI0037AE5BB6